ncbi:hypothetical protein ABL78_5030 [Leptomonas seymouri]|uniref:Uncharacterized protein n=1 Tax=Leptomonas seymouri TaxID=5684 RepID=A0A0N1PDT0_LEPSE|nr:hypothetical protein ABL78_5030 [Leptomonas seymouri]|eukprot:KPI85898.1 hypothetical protein ABL78_5030 [Leptomonas seymouri]
MCEDGNAVGSDQLSVVHLSRLHERVLHLRVHLRSALLDDSPQLEMIVFNSLFELYQNFYFDLFRARAAVAPTAARDMASSGAGAPAISAETHVVTSTYTQDILAACLYLIEVDAVSEVYAIPREPPPPELSHNDKNSSTMYVSKAQRHFCFLLFMYICWSSASLPLRCVLHALYPLLDPGVPQSTTQADSNASVAGEGADTETENSIASALFSQPRFASRKRWVGEVLSGLVLSRANGLRAVLRVLLLDDRVEDNSTVEAAQLMVRLLTTPPPAVWMLSGPTSSISSSSTKADAVSTGPADGTLCVVRTTSPSIETHVRSLAPQLLSLLEEHADEEDGDRSSAATDARESSRPHFLARLEALHQRLPAETVEQRLHLFATLYLNALVRLPPRQSSAFARCYRQFYYTNRYILSPGFGCLTLRGEGPYGEDEVVAALRRLTSLVKGVALGAGTSVLSHVLPATAAGVLGICAIQRTRVDWDTGATTAGQGRLHRTLQCFLKQLLANSSLYELTAHAFVQACGTAHSHSFCGGNAVLSGITYVNAACTAETLTGGFEWLLSAMVAPAPDFVHVCVEAMTDACQVTLFALEEELPAASSVLSSATPRSVDKSAPAETSEVYATPPLVLLLEQLCLAAPSEAIFGTRERLSLVHTCTLLGRLLALSPILYRWAVGMLSALMKSDSVRVALQDGLTRATTLPVQQLSIYEDGHALEERRRFLSRFVRASQRILSTLQMLHGPSHQQRSSGGTVALALIIEDDADLLALTAEACVVLEGRVAEAMRQLNECDAACAELSKGGKENCRRKVSSHQHNEAAVFVAAQWQQLLTQLQSALDGRSSVDIAIALASLSRSVDDVVHDVADPDLLRSVVQPLLLTLVRVLYECEEVGCAVRAVHCAAWLCMYRFDSPDSAFISDIVWAVLGEQHLPAWLATQIGCTTGKLPALIARACRLRVRLLDVLLAWTDYDEDGRTLRNVDDALRRTRHVPLYVMLVRLCHSSSNVFVQVATLHFVGAYALAVQPRVPLAALCDLCQDVFRLSSHEMAKAACAAALGKVVAALCQPCDAAALLLTEVDLNTCRNLASAMASYRGRPPGTVVKGTVASLTASSQGTDAELHDEVIQQHGRAMLQLLRNALQSLGAAPSAETPSMLQVKLPHV